MELYSQLFLVYVSNYVPFKIAKKKCIQLLFETIPTFFTKQNDLFFVLSKENVAYNSTSMFIVHEFFNPIKISKSKFKCTKNDHAVLIN